MILRWSVAIRSSLLSWRWCSYALKLTGLFGIFFLAILGATITEGLGTGLVVPHGLGISRVRTPIKFWLILSICAALIVVNIIGLFLRH